MSDESDPRIEAIAARVREREREEGEELLRPFDPGELRALSDGVFAALDEKSAEGEGRAAKVVALPKPRRRFGLALALLAAAFSVFGVALVLRKPGTAPIGAYSLSVEGGNREDRGEPPAPEAVIRLDPASRLALSLRPEAPVSGALAVRGFLVREGKARPWDVPAVVGAGGVVRVEGTVAALFGELPEGAWDLVLVVARPEALPDDAELAEAAAEGKTLPGVSMHRRHITLSRPHGERGAAPSGEGGARIDFAGCAAVRSPEGCELGPERRLWFFVPNEIPAAVSVRADGAAIEGRAVALRGGVRIEARIPEGAREVRARVTTPGDGRTRTLSLAAPEVVPEALAEAEAARRRGELDRAEGLVAPLVGAGSPEVARRAIRLKARIAMAMRERGEEVGALFRRAIAEDRRAGRVSDELDDTFALAYHLLIEERAFGEARALFDGIGRLVEVCPEGGPKAAYYRGLLGLETGDLRAALAAFSEASAGAERLGLDGYRSAVLEQESEVLAVLGRHGEASARLAEARRLAGPSADPCRRAQLASNEGWIALRAAAGSGRGLEEAKRVLEEARALAEGACPSGVGNVALNLALVALGRGEAKEARARLADARARGRWPGLEGWERMIEARLMLVEGKPAEALAANEALVAEGERLLSPELVFEGSLGRAEALAALDRRGEAREAFASSARALAAWGKGVPLGEGRATFFSARQRGATLAIDFLLREAERGDLGAAREAMEVARRSLAGVVEGFSWVNRVGALGGEGRRRWDDAASAYRRERALLEEKAAARGPNASGLDAERAALGRALDGALAALGDGKDEAEVALSQVLSPGEALVVVHPAPAGLAAFVMTDEGRRVEAGRLSPVGPGATPEVFAEAFFGPIAGALRAARRVRLVLPGELAEVDVHALPFEGAPLLERAEVVYALDLPRPSRPPSRLEGSTALVIADPTEDLPGARESAGDVVRALESRGLSVLRLQGEAATHEAVRDALERPSVRFLHYAGHATYEGPDGLEASLRLARRGRLSVADVMALTHVPEVVVLAGCDTARAGDARAGSAKVSVRGLGLAQAFLLKGARAAVSSPRPMADALAAEATRLLYEGPVERDPAAALRRATRALRRSFPVSDAYVLRMLVE